MMRRTMCCVLGLVLFAGLAVANGELEWPRQIETNGWTVTLYQPQIDSLEGLTLESRAAVSVVGPEVETPVFGAVWLTARLSTDRGERLATVVDVTVPQVRFPDASEENTKKLAELLEREIPKWEIVMSLDQIVTDLDEIGGPNQPDGIKHEPPTVLWSKVPAILVSLDGEPITQELENEQGQKVGVSRVVNTPFPMFEAGGTWYLSGGGDLWFQAPDARGPWSETSRVPSAVKAALPPEEAQAGAPDEEVEEPEAIFVALEPTELIVTAGDPQWSPLEGTDLLYVTNTDANIVMELGGQTTYVLLSGRWFSGPAGLEGPWSFVAFDALPETFEQIPSDSAMGHVRSHVPDTDEARESVLDATIPQTAAIKRDDTSLKVEYDGNPEFAAVEGAEGLSYAKNSPQSVFKFENSYYACEQGVWYQSSSARGPWLVATSIPSTIYEIPVSNPHHNVTYVKVYDVTPEVVYVGYTPGYMGSYYWGGCMVWGTGWWYRPWYRSYYYPYHRTWGFSVRYNPWYGWSFGLTWSNGPFSIHFGRGGYGPGYGWWGPGGYRPYPRPYVRPGYTRPVVNINNTININRGNVNTGNRVSTLNQNIYNRPQNRDRAVASRDKAGPRPSVMPDRANDVLTDRAGNVYRRNENGSFDRREGGQWRPQQPSTTPERPSTRPSQPSTRPSQPSTRPSQPSTRPSQPSTRPSQPSTRPSQPSTRPSQPSTRPSSGVQRDWNSRQRGSQRSQQYRQHRSRPAGGGARRR
jgi:hypothetical protein